MPDRDLGKEVAEPAPGNLAGAADREMIATLRGGTRAMRAAGDKYLPKEEKETTERYQMRLKRSYLFPALSNTGDRIISRPFAKEVTIRGDYPERLEVLRRNTDRAGATLTMFLRWVFTCGVYDGVSFVFVDSQQARPAPGADNLAELTGEKRPFFVAITADDLLGWNHVVDDDTGQEIPMFARWREVRMEEDGPYGQREVNYIKVVWAASTSPAGELVPGRYELWREDNDNENQYTMVEDGPFAWSGRGLPIFAYYTNRKSTFVADPPLIDLAWKNIEHWQVGSDYTMALRFALLILLTGTGLSPDEISNGIVLGHGAWNGFESPDAKIEFTETKGASLEQGRASKTEIREEMEILGLQPFLRSSANTTATSQRSADDKNEAPIQTWVRNLNAFARQLIEAAAEWLRLEISKDLRVEVFNEFKLLGDRATAVDVLLKLKDKNALDLETLLAEVQRLGYLSDELDPEELAAAAREETEAMVAAFNVPDDDGDNDVGDNAA